MNSFLPIHMKHYAILKKVTKLRCNQKQNDNAKQERRKEILNKY